MGCVSYTPLLVSCSDTQDAEIRFQFSDSLLGSFCGECARFGGGRNSASSGGVRFGGSALSLGSVLAVMADVIRHRGGSDRDSVGVDPGRRNWRATVLRRDYAGQHTHRPEWWVVDRLRPCCRFLLRGSFLLESESVGADTIDCNRLESGWWVGSDVAWIVLRAVRLVAVLGPS